MRTSYPIHEAAEMFPMMDRDGLAALAEDIRRHGQQVQVELYDGQIIDGRNRAEACRMAGVEVATTDVTQLLKSQDLSPHDYVLSDNMYRRHLTPSQRAMIGQRYKEHEAAVAEKRRRATLKKGDELPEVENVPHREQQGKARDKAGAKVDVSGKMIDLADRIRRDGAPELAEAIERGDVTLHAAKRIVTLPREDQAALVRQGPEAVRQKARELRMATRQSNPPAELSMEPAAALHDVALHDVSLQTTSPTVAPPDSSPETFDLDRQSRDLRGAIMERLACWPAEFTREARAILYGLANESDAQWRAWTRSATPVTDL